MNGACAYPPDFDLCRSPIPRQLQIIKRTSALYKRQPISVMAATSTVQVCDVTTSLFWSVADASASWVPGSDMHTYAGCAGEDNTYQANRGTENRHQWPS